MASNASVALLLEDEPLISMDIEMILEEAGFAVTTVMSCQEASDWLANFKPDIAIVEIELRDGPCLGIAEWLVEADIPFVVHSGEPASMYVGTPFAHGRWMGKPAEPCELAAAARALLSPY
jgi:DNA-binding response OmpR family regulator